MNIEEALFKIYGLHQFHVKLGLDNIRKLLNHIGNPQKKLKVIHVAGSNGKGSTSSFLASILQEAGFKTALYTSPHLVRFNERIRINGEMISDEYITNFINELDPYIEANRPTFFEITTALAFKYFAEKNVDIAVIEVGLGGRLDATNTIENPLASVITSISKEHTNILTDNLETITREKAGIIKENTNVFTGILPPISYPVIENICREKFCNLFKLKDYIFSDEDYSSLIDTEFQYNFYNPVLKGSYQYLNVALAVLVLKKTFPEIEDEAIFRGISKVKENSGIGGRYEIYSEKPKVILDGSHNLEGIELFIKEFNREKDRYKSVSLIFGAMKDKNLNEILTLLRKNFDDITYSTIDYERAAEKEDYKKLLSQEGKEIKFTYEPEKLITDFISQNEGDKCLVVLGSFYLIGKIKENLQKS